MAERHGVKSDMFVLEGILSILLRLLPVYRVRGLLYAAGADGSCIRGANGL